MFKNLVNGRSRQGARVDAISSTGLKPGYAQA